MNEVLRIYKDLLIKKDTALRKIQTIVYSPPIWRNKYNRRYINVVPHCKEHSELSIHGL